MNGEIAQAIALVCQGNAVIRGFKPPRFFPDSPMCQFCERVTFVELGEKLPGYQEERPVAEDPDSWLTGLSRTGTRGFAIRQKASPDIGLPERMAAAFVGGGGTWMIEALNAQKAASSTWVARWEVGNQDAPDQRIWRVTYGMIGKGASTSQPIDLDDARRQLLSALGEIADFAERNDCAGFLRCFERARASLENPEAGASRASALAPRDVLPDRAIATLKACQEAWVFGGMGSWNDLGVDGEEYDRVSEELYRSLNQAIIAATNCSLPSG